MKLKIFWIMIYMNMIPDSTPTPETNLDETES